MSALHFPAAARGVSSSPLSSHRPNRLATVREDLIFRAILPSSRAAQAAFELSGDWGEEVLAEGDIVAPLIS